VDVDRRQPDDCEKGGEWYADEGEAGDGGMPVVALPADSNGRGMALVSGCGHHLLLHIVEEHTSPPNAM
jgi:hypothetical protein